jgi:TIR- and PNP-associating SLOG family
MNFVISFGRDPKLADHEDGPSIIFDWTVADAVRAALIAGTASASGDSGRLLVTVGTERTFAQIPEHKLEIYTEFRAAKCLHMECIDPGWGSGAVRRQRQAQLGDILIAISGGEGVEHLAQEFAELGKHVVPLDLDLGASCKDGSGGAARLFGEALRNPGLFLRAAQGESASELLDATRTQNGRVPAKQVAAAVVDLLERLTGPRVFYVRQMNKDLITFGSVEKFFRSVVDPTVTELGLEPFQVDTARSEHPWINQAIFDSLHRSEVVVADLTGARPNCHMELGYALGHSQRVIVTAQKGTVLPFDSSCLETFPWDATEPAEECSKRFREHWARNIDTPPLVRPRGLR